VFDGVSGAAETQGVDPRLFSQTLAALTADKARKYGPKGVVKAAMEASRENKEIGASTACVLGLDEFGRLFGVNLGDSGVFIVRDRKILFRTKEQQHFFNCPYQLSSVTSAGVNNGDSIAMGQNIQQSLQVGDWIILATDGLFDNVFPKDIVSLVNQAKASQELADQLGDLAADNSVDKERSSPFEGAARMAKVEWKGGKVDDVTVIVLRVKDDPNHQPLTLLSSLPGN
jgi:protein phosphatase PTC7